MASVDISTFLLSASPPNFDLVYLNNNLFTNQPFICHKNSNEKNSQSSLEDPNNTTTNSPTINNSDDDEESLESFYAKSLRSNESDEERLKRIKQWEHYYNDTNPRKCRSDDGGRGDGLGSDGTGSFIETTSTSDDTDDVNGNVDGQNVKKKSRKVYFADENGLKLIDRVKFHPYPQNDDDDDDDDDDSDDDGNDNDSVDNGKNNNLKLEKTYHINGIDIKRNDKDGDNDYDDDVVVNLPTKRVNDIIDDNVDDACHHHHRHHHHHHHHPDNDKADNKNYNGRKRRSNHITKTLKKRDNDADDNDDDDDDDNEEDDEDEDDEVFKDDEQSKDEDDDDDDDGDYNDSDAFNQKNYAKDDINKLVSILNNANVNASNKTTTSTTTTTTSNYNHHNATNSSKTNYRFNFLSPQSTLNPEIFTTKLSTNQISLDRILFANDIFIGTVWTLANGGAQDKTVSVRCSYDDWLTYFDLIGLYVGQGSLLSLHSEGRYDIYKFKLNPKSCRSLICNRICLAARLGFRDGREVWDNNDGKNYIIERVFDPLR